MLLARKRRAMGGNPPELVPNRRPLTACPAEPPIKSGGSCFMAHRLMRSSSMSKSRNQELWEKGAEQRERCRNWLLPFMRDDKPKFLTKAELREAALRELGVSKSSFDFGWIEAIEQTGRHDWYEPLRRRPRSKN